MITSAERFEEAVFEAFRFLEFRNGFRKQVEREGSSTSVIYRNRRIYVRVSYGPPAYEPEVSFGRIGIDDAPGAYNLEIGDLIQLDECRNWHWNSEITDRVVGTVSEFARLIAECGHRVLNADQAAFDQMKHRRQERINEWLEDESKIALKNQIDEAWNSNNFLEVIRLYNQANWDLSATEHKRLFIANQRAGV